MLHEDISLSAEPALRVPVAQVGVKKGSRSKHDSEGIHTDNVRGRFPVDFT